MKERTKRGAAGVRRHVASDHRRLDALFRDTRAAFVRATAGGAFGRLREALLGHLAQEDCLYYPAIAALRPEYAGALHALATAHDDFRRRLARVAARLARGEVEAARTRFDALVREFGRHERREERLLGEIERAGAPAA
ncbi:MAG TPA: hemerythrin domain-containing protein [Candidatus Binatia bacterium]|nr:hemerythrin domain-containing protein [Candidatus Binatia bacterium]